MKQSESWHKVGGYLLLHVSICINPGSMHFISVDSLLFFAPSEGAKRQLMSDKCTNQMCLTFSKRSRGGGRGRCRGCEAMQARVLISISLSRANKIAIAWKWNKMIFFFLGSKITWKHVSVVTCRPRSCVSDVIRLFLVHELVFISKVQLVTPYVF